MARFGNPISQRAWKGNRQLLTLRGLPSFWNCRLVRFYGVGYHSFAVRLCFSYFCSSISFSYRDFLHPCLGLSRVGRFCRLGFLCFFWVCGFLSCACRCLVCLRHVDFGDLVDLRGLWILYGLWDLFDPLPLDLLFFACCPRLCGTAGVWPCSSRPQGLSPWSD